MLSKLALRDVSFIALVGMLWWGAANLSAGSGMLGDFIGLVLGLAFGVCVHLLHEWGHLLGGLAVRSDVRLPERLGSAYLFSFDSRRNTRRQFLIMSFSGFAVTGAAVWSVYALLPDGLLATRVARGATLVLASLTLFLEFPLVLWSLLRPTLPPVETFRAHRRERRAAA